MTVLIADNEYKYELEAVIKLFFPAERFNFVYDYSVLDGDICEVRLKKRAVNTYIFVRVRIGGEQARRCAIVDSFSSEYKGDCERELCRRVYLCLESLTGRKNEWGMLTGVRPVKFVRRLSESGMNPDDIAEYLKKTYFVTDKKAALAYNIYKLQSLVAGKSDEKKFSLYVSIPFCPTRCSYCSFISSGTESSKKLIPQYVSLLCDELSQIAIITSRLSMLPETVYFGGGTPTAISGEQLGQLLDAVAKNFNLSALREYTVEAGRPDTVTEEKLRLIKSHGVGRISINPQTLNDSVLEKIGRKHSAADFFKSYALARKIGFASVNTDVIAGLPADSLESFKSTIDGLIDLDPENITVHALTLKRSAGMYSQGESALRGSVGAMLDYSRWALGQSGYLPYYLYRQKNTAENLENTGYSLGKSECLYNIYIMDDTHSIIGAGCGASTKLVRGDNDMERFFNFKYPFEYIGSFDEMNMKKSAIEKFFCAEPCGDKSAKNH